MSTALAVPADVPTNGHLVAVFPRRHRHTCSCCPWLWTCRRRDCRNPAGARAEYCARCRKVAARVTDPNGRWVWR